MPQADRFGKGNVNIPDVFLPQWTPCGIQCKIFSTNSK